LANFTNRYFYQWDTSIPDEWRYEVWKDQFDQDVKNRTMPAFEFMPIMVDHTGSFGSNVANLETPELDVPILPPRPVTVTSRGAFLPKTVELKPLPDEATARSRHCSMVRRSPPGFGWRRFHGFAAALECYSRRLDRLSHRAPFFGTLSSTVARPPLMTPASHLHRVFVLHSYH
jgi:hypothetical protein